jgi:VWFA-related protein
MRWACFGIAAAATWFLASGHAQAPLQGSAPEQSGIRITKTVRLVQVEVIAKDKKGRPVTGLEAKDFSLRENGRMEKISVFSAESRDSEEAKLGAESAEGQSAPNHGRVFSNNHPANAAPVVILLDWLNTPRENQPAMKRALLASLQHSSQQVPVALLILKDDLELVSDFTTNTALLGDSLEKPSTSRSEGFGPSITAPKTSSERFNDVILRAAIHEFNRQSGDRVNRTMAALSVIRSQLGRMRGRKSLIWLGAGLTVAPNEWPFVRSVIDDLNDADVAVYTVDARGVLLGYGTSADIDEQDMLGPWAEAQAETRGDILDVMARNTGGVPYRNTNALDGAITRALEDNRTVYTLGYYPQRDDWQGKPIRIEVKVARPGVSLRYRSVYPATPEANPQSPDSQQMLTAIAESPLDFPGMRFTVEVKPQSDPSHMSFTLHIPASEIRLTLQEEKLVGALQLWFIQREPSGKDLTSKTSAFGFQLTSNQYNDALDHGLTLTSVLTLQDGTAKVRVLLRDNTSGRIGTVDVPVNSLTNKSTPRIDRRQGEVYDR